MYNDGCRVPNMLPPILNCTSYWLSLWTKNFHSFMICLSFSCLNFMFCFILSFSFFRFLFCRFHFHLHAWILMHERSVPMIWYELRTSILSWYVFHFHVWISCSVSFSFSFFRFHFHIHLTYERYAWMLRVTFSFDPFWPMKVAHDCAWKLSSVYKLQCLFVISIVAS